MDTVRPRFKRARERLAGDRRGTSVKTCRVKCLPDLRKYYGWTQGDVANTMGVSQAEVSSFERMACRPDFQARYRAALKAMGHNTLKYGLDKRGNPMVPAGARKLD